MSGIIPSAASPKMVEVPVYVHGAIVLKIVPAQEMFDALKQRYFVRCHAFCMGDIGYVYEGQINRA